MKLTGTSLMLGLPPPLWGREQTAAWGGNANIGALNTRPL